MPPKKLSKTKPEPKKRARSATTPVKPVKKAAKAEEDKSAPAKVAASKNAIKTPAPKPKAAAKSKTPVAKVASDAAPAPAAAPKKATPAPAPAPKKAGAGGGKAKGVAVFRSVPGRDSYTVFEDYSCTLNQTDVVNNNNKYYLLTVLVDGAGNYSFYSEWGRVGAPNPQNSFVKNIPQASAIAQFTAKFQAKTANSWSNRNNFQKIDGKYQLVEVEAGDDDGNDEDSSPLGKLTKAQLEQGLEVLDQLKPLLDKKNRSSTDDAEIKRLNSKFFSLVPTDVGFKKAENLIMRTPEALHEKKGSILFLMKMAFSVEKKKPKKVPAKVATSGAAAPVVSTTTAAAPTDTEEIDGENKLSGVLSLPVPKTLNESLKNEYGWAVNSAVQSSEQNVKNKSGDQVKPMNKEQIGAIKLYTGSWYGTINTPLRTSNRKTVQKFFSYIRLLKDACDSLKQCQRMLYRGIGCDLSEEYKVGNTITWWAISSTTSAESVAKGFMKAWSGGCTFCTIKTKSAVEISQLSFFPHEKEFLLLPGTQLKVNKAWKEGKIFHVDLEEVGTAMTA